MFGRKYIISFYLAALTALMPFVALADEGHGHDEGGSITMVALLTAGVLAVVVVGGAAMMPSIKLNTFQLAIVGLGLITAVIHFFAGTGGEALLLLNAFGYIVLLVALFAPLESLIALRPLLRIVLLLYTLVTFVAYFMLHTVDQYSSLEIFTKVVEIGLMLVLISRLLQLRVVPPSAVR